MPRRRRIHIGPNQVSLFAGAPRPPAPPPPPPPPLPKGPDAITIAFNKFDAKHPEVFEQLLLHVEGLMAAGHKHYGIGALFESFRWHEPIPNQRDASEVFKLNNSYRSRYVRKMIGYRPHWASFFEIRALSSERKPK